MRLQTFFLLLFSVKLVVQGGKTIDKIRKQNCLRRRVEKGVKVVQGKVDVVIDGKLIIKIKFACGEFKFFSRERHFAFFLGEPKCEHSSRNEIVRIYMQSQFFRETFRELWDKFFYTHETLSDEGVWEFYFYKIFGGVFKTKLWY